MANYSIRSMQVSELKDFYPHIKKDFASGEYPPMDILAMHMQEDRQEGFVLCDGTNDIAYAFCAVSSAHGYVLLSLFAVFEAYRGKGIGSIFLKELDLCYADKLAIIVEVERPEDARTKAEQEKRQWRIAFYEKEGFQLIQGIDYIIWDIPMHLMALVLNVSYDFVNKQIKEIMHLIYSDLSGKRFINKLQIQESIGKDEKK